MPTTQVPSNTIDTIMAYYPEIALWSEAMRNEFFQGARTTRHAPGKIVKKAGSYSDAVSFVLAGIFRVYLPHQREKEITLYETGPGEICRMNMFSILADVPLEAQAMAVSELELLHVDKDHFLHQVNAVAEVRRFVFRRMGQEYAELLELLSEVVFTRLSRRLENYLVEKSEAGILKTTHNKIANDLGTAREVITRLLKLLEVNDKIRSQPGSIDVNNLIG